MNKKFRDRRLSFIEDLGVNLPNFEFEPGPWKRVRGSVWLSYVLWKTGWSWVELKERVGENRIRSSLVSRWRKGEVSPSRQSAKKLKDDVPGSLELFDNPAWWLLRNYPVAKREVSKSVSSYYAAEGGFFAYRFPDVLSPIDKMQSGKIPLSKDDSMMLYMRGDIHAFALILALVRKTEAMHYDDQHMLHMADLFRLLPTLGRLPYIRPHFDLIREMVEALHGRVLYTRFMIGADWKLIAEQMVSDQFYPWHPRISRDEIAPKNRILVDPVTEGEIIPAERIPWPDSTSVCSEGLEMPT